MDIPTIHANYAVIISDNKTIPTFLSDQSITNIQFQSSQELSIPQLKEEIGIPNSKKKVDFLYYQSTHTNQRKALSHILLWYPYLSKDAYICFERHNGLYGDGLFWDECLQLIPFHWKRIYYNGKLAIYARSK
jgi:hypothetical protein